MDIGDLYWTEDSIGSSAEADYKEISAYFSAMLNYLAARKTDVTPRVAVELQGLSDDEVELFWDSELGAEVRYLDESFPQLLTSNVAITAYSRLERTLDRICQREMRVRSLVVAPADLRGQGIQRSVSYLEKVVGVTLSNRELWEDILVFATIRNAFAHAEGMVSPNKIKHVQDYEKKYPGMISVTEFLKGKVLLDISEQFCHHAIAQCLAFVKTTLYDLGRTESPETVREKRRPESL